MSDRPNPAAGDWLPTWEYLETRFVEDGVPGLVVVRERPRIALFVDPEARAYGAYFEVGDMPSLPALAVVRSREVRIEGSRQLELSVGDPRLFRTFHLLLTDLISRVVRDEVGLARAAGEALAQWRALLQQTALLSDERQSGLFGELWLLARLIRARGPAATDAWTGPLREAHDFRVAGVDFEVKTTFGARRVHVVNGLAQLAPVAGVPLFLLSIRLQVAGEGGQTLSQAVAEVSDLLRDAPAEAAWFRTLIERVGYRDEDEPLYSTRRRLADHPKLIAVVDECPRLTSDALSLLPRGFAAERIQDVSYRIDVEGLGLPDGAPEFLALLPAAGGPPPGND